MQRNIALAQKVIDDGSGTQSLVPHDPQICESERADTIQDLVALVRCTTGLLHNALSLKAIRCPTSAICCQLTELTQSIFSASSSGISSQE